MRVTRPNIFTDFATDFESSLQEEKKEAMHSTLTLLFRESGALWPFGLGRAPPVLKANTVFSFGIVAEVLELIKMTTFPALLNFLMNSIRRIYSLDRYIYQMRSITKLLTPQYVSKK